MYRFQVSTSIFLNTFNAFYYMLPWQLLKRWLWHYCPVLGHLSSSMAPTDASFILFSLFFPSPFTSIPFPRLPLKKKSLSKLFPYSALHFWMPRVFAELSTSPLFSQPLSCCLQPKTRVSGFPFSPCSLCCCFYLLSVPWLCLSVSLPPPSLLDLDYTYHAT